MNQFARRHDRCKFRFIFIRWAQFIEPVGLDRFCAAMLNSPISEPEFQLQGRSRTSSGWEVRNLIASGFS
jgi:hypothetical protein